ncbi:MAG: efflux transporter periplasmic adaptor subunit, partial [Pseudomonadota bacterium]|nr:efflux transporter periplasmic adaptor subunit [Pseudomonadota bacterium]
MRFLRQSLLGVLLAAVTLALLVYAVQIVAGAVQTRLSTVAEPPRARERVFPVNVVRAEPGRVEPVLDTFGQIQSRRTLELRAAVQGRVIDLAESFVEGGSVSAGQVLVQIDPADAKAELERAENDLLDAEAEQRDADRSLTLSRDELAAAQEQADVR